ncbi:hypothetical protein KVU_0855 [Ketogulonicigenium vulgare WSH-001]|uniref:Uncharacterized protein n=1 Tax=Ketogulonicigenium vulgare (strain WSH-001) TaxID=759362 RepID=F9Y562_KETVW|nr:hypothetical protein KVU_0855 [Ketogulonicigenium vulgare WSH-001]
MHRLGDDQLIQLAATNLALHQMGGDDAHGRAAGLLCGAGDKAHQADIARAVNQAPVIARDHRTRGTGQFCIMRQRAIARAAVYAD